MRSVARLSSGSAFETTAGYSRVVVVEHDGWTEALVSGTTGFDYARMSIEDDVEAQTRQTFANLAQALERVGMTLRDVVRVRYYLTDAADFERLAPLFGEAFAEARPAATAIVCGLIDPRMKIEIEVDARKAASA